MNFDERKKQIIENLKKGIDKSRKGRLDKPIEDLVWLINSLNEYYTTSSCSGRIMLQSSPIIGKKWENKWYFVSHDYISESDLEKIFDIIDTFEDVWFRVDPAILHIASRDVKSAEKMLKVARASGFKRAGIISFKKWLIEAISTEHIEMPLVVDGKKLIEKDKIKLLIKIANEKLKRTHKKIKKFEENIKIYFEIV